MICTLCDRVHWGLGLCRRHYDMYRKWGDPFYNRNEQEIHNHSQNCSIEGCNEPYSCKGLCKFHYMQKRQKENNKKLVNYSKDYYKTHKKEFLEYNRNWRSKNPDKKLEQTKRYLKKYGVIFDMNAMQYLHAMQSWSRSIKKMDNFMCKNCDSTINLNAHHLMPKSLFPELSLDLSNGITLCKKCHSEIHGFFIYAHV